MKIKTIPTYVYRRLCGRSCPYPADRNSYVRSIFRRKLEELASVIVENQMMRGLLTENGEFYIYSYDNIYLYYNYSDNRYTFGDGQSLDFRTAHCDFPLEKFLLSCLNDGMVYFDIGANNGYYYSLKVAKRFSNCRIYSFEPDPAILHHLNKNVSHNNLSNITVVPQALSDAVGMAKMTANLGASNFLIREDFSSRIVIDVPCNTLDNFVRQNNVECIDLMKVDIEGGEYSFLKGARESIQNHQPILILELNDALLRRSGASIESALSFLSGMNYTCYLVEGSSDTVAIPMKKLDLLSSKDQGWLREIRLHG